MSWRSAAGGSRSAPRRSATSCTGCTSSTLSLNSGAARHEITLGKASASVPVEINGGALTVNIHRPGGTPVSVDVSGGAVNLTGDGKGMHGIGHLSYASPDYTSGGAGYSIEISGGACTVTVDSSG